MATPVRLHVSEGFGDLANFVPVDEGLFAEAAVTVEATPVVGKKR